MCVQAPVWMWRCESGEVGVFICALCIVSRAEAFPARPQSRARRQGREKKNCWVFDAKMKCHICPRGVRVCARVYVCGHMQYACSGNLCNYCPPFFALAHWTENADGRTALSWHKQSRRCCFAWTNVQRRSKSCLNVMWLQVLHTETGGQPLHGRTRPKNRVRLRGSQGHLT